MAQTVIIENTLKCAVNMPLECVKRGSQPLSKMLAPGPNTVDVAALEKITKGYKREAGRSDVKPNKVVARWFEEGELVDKGEGEAVGLADSLESLNVGEARKQIGACTEPKILARWAANETRKTVQAAIDARLKAIETGDDDPDDDED